MEATLDIERHKCTSAVRPAPMVSPDTYADEYYLTDAEGKEEYLETGGREFSPRLSRTWALADIRPGMKVLDLGHGRGEIVYHCALNGAKVTGVDYSDSANKLTRNILKNLPRQCRRNASLIHADIRELIFPENYYDRIFLLDIVEHLSHTELALVLRGVRRALKKGGKCIIHTMPNRLYWDVGYRYYMKWIDALIKFLMKGKPIIQQEGRNHYSLAVHINEQTIWSMKRVLRKHGLKGKVWLEDDFFNRKNFDRCTWSELLYEAIMRIWPISHLWPLKYIFHHTIYAIVEKTEE